MEKQSTSSFNINSNFDVALQGYFDALKIKTRSAGNESLTYKNAADVGLTGSDWRVQGRQGYGAPGGAMHILPDRWSRDIRATGTSRVQQQWGYYMTTAGQSNVRREVTALPTYLAAMGALTSGMSTQWSANLRFRNRGDDASTVYRTTMQTAAGVATGTGLSFCTPLATIFSYMGMDSWFDQCGDHFTPGLGMIPAHDHTVPADWSPYAKNLYVDYMSSADAVNVRVTSLGDYVRYMSGELEPVQEWEPSAIAERVVVVPVNASINQGEALVAWTLAFSASGLYNTETTVTPVSSTGIEGEVQSAISASNLSHIDGKIPTQVLLVDVGVMESYGNEWYRWGSTVVGRTHRLSTDGQNADCTASLIEFIAPGVALQSQRRSTAFHGALETWVKMFWNEADWNTALTWAATGYYRQVPRFIGTTQGTDRETYYGFDSANNDQKFVPFGMDDSGTTSFNLSLFDHNVTNVMPQAYTATAPSAIYTLPAINLDMMLSYATGKMITFTDSTPTLFGYPSLNVGIANIAHQLGKLCDTMSWVYGVSAMIVWNADHCVNSGWAKSLRNVYIKAMNTVFTKSNIFLQHTGHIANSFSSSDELKGLTLQQYPSCNYPGLDNHTEIDLPVSGPCSFSGEIGGNRHDYTTQDLSDFTDRFRIAGKLRAVNPARPRTTASIRLVPPNMDAIIVGVAPRVRVFSPYNEQFRAIAMGRDATSNITDINLDWFTSTSMMPLFSGDHMNLRMGVAANTPAYRFKSTGYLGVPHLTTSSSTMDAADTFVGDDFSFPVF